MGHVYDAGQSNAIELVECSGPNDCCLFQQAFLTGGSDKKIQFWNFELKDEKDVTSKKVKLRWMWTATAQGIACTEKLHE